MPILSVRNIGSTGVNSDIEPWDLPPDALTDGINYRLSANKLQSVGGTKPMAPASGDELGHITQSTDFLGNSTWVLAGENTVKLYDGSTYTNVGDDLRAREARFANLDPTKWSSCQIGQVVYLSHPQLYPIYWVNQGGNMDMEPLWWHEGEETWDDKGNSCRILKAHKNWLFALGMQEGPTSTATRCGGRTLPSLTASRSRGGLHLSNLTASLAGSTSAVVALSWAVSPCVTASSSTPSRRST